MAACDGEGGGKEAGDPAEATDGGKRDGSGRGGEDRGDEQGDEPSDGRSAGGRDAAPDASRRDRDAGLADAGDASSLGGDRLQDRRQFTLEPSSLPFFALSDAPPADRWFGSLAGAGYRVEVPAAWNGQLVMYAHDYQGVNPALSVRSPSLRRHFLEQGFAWAASTYTRNYYDVRAGVEDTNALALAFTKIAAENGRPLAMPAKIYVMGHAMGGHVAGAAVERETEQRARNKVHYDGALALCGAMGDLELFRYFAAYQVAAQQLGNVPIARWPVPDYPQVRGTLQRALFNTFPTATTALGDRLRALVMNLSGGARPLFDQGFASNDQANLWNAFAGDGWLFGVLSDAAVDTHAVVYQLDGDPTLSADEDALNRSVFRVTGAPDDVLNPPRADGLRWVPPLKGEIGVPVISLHTLGDVLMPFSMEQIYRKRVVAQNHGDLLVQRAIRAAGHCDLTVSEQAAAFDALVAWAQGGAKPEGDDVLDPGVVGAPSYGCKFTDNRITVDDPSVLATERARVPACAP